MNSLYQRFLRIILLVLIVGTLLPQSMAAQSPLPFDPPLLALPCYGGAKPPVLNPRCVVITVVDINGHRQRGIRLTITVNATTIDRTTGPILGLDGSMVGVALDVSLYGAELGDVITVETQQSGPKQLRLIAVNPDPITMTQYAPPIMVGPYEPLGYPLIWGRAYTLNSPTPLSGATVGLWNLSQGTPTPIMTTTTVPDEDGNPYFGFDPRQLRPGTRLEIRALWENSSYPLSDTLRRVVQFTWQNQQIEVPVVFGTNCSEHTPRGGEGKGLPGFYCLRVYAQLNGKPVTQAQVSVVIPQDTSLMNTTTITNARTTVQSIPMAIFDIGPAMLALPDTTPVTISALLSEQNLLGIHETTIGELKRQGPWEAAVTVELLGIFLNGQGLTGGMASTSTKVGNTLYLGSRWGGVSAQYAPGGPIIRLPGTAEHLLPNAEITAITGWRQGETDWLIIGMRGGMLAYSSDSGRTWNRIANQVPDTTAIRQLIVTEPGVVYGVASKKLFNIHVSSDGIPVVSQRWRSETPLTAVALVDTTFYIGREDGLFTWSEGSTMPSLVREGTITALATISSVWLQQPALLIGTPEGLSLRHQTNDDRWLETDLKLSGPIKSVSVSDGNNGSIVATTDSGVYSTNSVSLPLAWTMITLNEPLLPSANGPYPHSLGLPTVYDLSIVDDRTIVGTSTGVAWSDDDGRSWHDLPALEATPTISVSGRGRTYFALTPQGLWRIRPQSTAWEPVIGLPTPLNGSIVRISPHGSIAVGSGGGTGMTLHLSSDDGLSWQSLAVGTNRGITAIEWFTDNLNQERAIIATDGDGLYELSPNGNLTPLPGLPGGATRISALAVNTIGICSIIVGTYNAAAQIVSRPCDTTSPWNATFALPMVEAMPIALVTDITIAQTGRIFATTSDGLLIGTPTTGWNIVPGMPQIPLTVVSGIRVPQRATIGGLGGGVLVFNDISPDLQITVNGPSQAKGDQVITYTASIINLGQQGVTSTLRLRIPRELDLSSGSLIVPISLAPSSQITLMYTFKVTRNVELSTVPLHFELDRGTNERYEANNKASIDLELDYRDAPDLRLAIAGKLMALRGETAKPYIAVINDGNQSAVSSTVQVTFPLSMELGIPTRPVIDQDGRTYTWNIPPLLPGEQFAVTIPYSQPYDMEGRSVAVSATLEATGDDRMPINNTQVAHVQQLTGQPEVLVVIDRSQLLGSTTRLNTALADDTKSALSIELALDQDGPCNLANPIQLACLRQNLNQAVRDVAETPVGTPEHTIALANFKTRHTILTNEITRRIKDVLTTYKTIKYIYFIGDDSVIPGAAHYINDPQNDVLDESSYLPMLHPYDIVRGVMENNGYVTDVPYETALSNPYEKRVFSSPRATVATARTISSGRFVGATDDIAAMIEATTRIRQQSVLYLNDGILLGTVPFLTEDIQKKVCEDNDAYFNEPAICDRILPTIKSSLDLFTDTAALIGLTGHGDQQGVNDLYGMDVLETTFQQTSVMVILACHAGLAVGRAHANQVPFVTALNARRQIGYGFTSFVLAAETINNQPAIGYGEEIYLNLMKLLINGESGSDITLGKALIAARSNYGQINKRATNTIQGQINIQTMDALRLYGPPDLKVSRLKPGFTQQSATTKQSSWTGDMLSIVAMWSVETGSRGILYNATVADMETRLLAELGRTTQSAVVIPLPADATTVKIVDAQYRDLPGTDPVIPVIAPLSSPSPYGEPAYQGKNHDWAHEILIYTDSNGQRYARIPLGEWKKQGQIQRLYDRMTIRVKRGSAADGSEDVNWEVSACRVDQTATKITVSGAKQMESTELVVGTNGEVSTLPLARHGNRWEVTTTLPAGTAFAIQGITEDGSLIMDTNNGQLYDIPEIGCN